MSGDWTALAEGYTDFIPFNPATTLVEWRYTEQQAPADGAYYTTCNLYTTGSTSWAGNVQVYYSWTSGKVTDSWVRLYVVGGGGGYCYDTSVLQGQLADLVTVNMTSAHIVTINSTAEVDFTSCSGYQDWVNLVNSGNVTRIKMYLGCGSPACEAVSTEYRLRNKSK